MNPLPPAQTPILAERDSGKDFHKGCFACGVCNPLGLHLHFYVREDGVAAAVWSPTPEYSSYPDRVHGGIIATLLDSAMVHALFAMDVAGVTVESTIRYRNPVKLYEPAHIAGWVDAVRHGLYLCRAEIHQADQRIVWNQAKFMSMPNMEPNPASRNTRT
jgi:acyl-coenzyme A thioesterase PaaI-like protein